MANYDSDDENTHPLGGGNYGGFGRGAGGGGGNLFGPGPGAGGGGMGRGMGGPFSGLFGGMTNGPMGMMSMGGGPAPPSAFNKPYRAYSMALHEIQQGRGNQGASMTDGGRTQVMFGGQIMMPPSALRHLTELDIDGPWTFELINPINRELKTHAGVLEFTADEGVVYLPSWMMKRLELQEGDGIRIFGTRLPKGKFTKLQAQSVTFLELSDPKAVLEQALRSYTALTTGDIIEISYNSMTFELLVQETQPVGAGIGILNTDLEVDFDAPKGYVEPERKPLAPPPTMASKLKINTDQTQDVDAKGSGRSTPAAGPSTSAAGGSTSQQIAKDVGGGKTVDWEAFKGTGNSMSGKRVKGKGVSAKKIEEVEKDSKIIRTNTGPRIITADTQIGGRKVPAALNLPEGVLFFGYKYIPPKKSATAEETEAAKENAGGHKPPDFTGAGAGVTLSGRAPPGSSAAAGGSGTGGSVMRKKKAATAKAKTSKASSSMDIDNEVIQIDSD